MVQTCTNINVSCLDVEFPFNNFNTKSRSSCSCSLCQGVLQKNQTRWHLQLPVRSRIMWHQRQQWGRRRRPSHLRKLNRFVRRSWRASLRGMQMEMPYVGPTIWRRLDARTRFLGAAAKRVFIFVWSVKRTIIALWLAGQTDYRMCRAQRWIQIS